MSIEVKPGRQRRAIRPRAVTAASALFQLARLAHEKNALEKLAGALRKRLDTIGSRVADLDGRAVELGRIAGLSKRSKPGRRRASDLGRRSREPELRHETDPSERRPPGTVKVMSWKF